MLTISQLTEAVTEDEALETALDTLAELGFQATSWQDGSIQLTLLRLFCRTWSSLTGVVSKIASGGFTTLATGDFLKLLAKYVYDIEALPASAAVGQILLTSSAAAPVHTWIAGDLIVADAEQGTDGANTYTVQEAGSLGPGSTLSIEFKADVAGEAANIAPDTELFLWTPLVGVTPTNPALVPESNTWITTPGQDEESDQRLAARCIAKWSRLSYGNIEGAYRGWVLEALPAVTRLMVASAPGDGSVTIYAATSLGPITEEQADEIEDYINGVTDGIGRRPINDILEVLPATTVTSPDLDITAYVESAESETAAAAIEAALLEYIGSIPLGGTRLGLGDGVVVLSDLIDIARDQDGVRSVLFDISDNIPLGAGEIYLPTINITVIAVGPGV